MKDKETKEVILALYPNKRGIGFAVMNGPEELVDYGQRHIRSMSICNSLKRVREYLNYYEPSIVLLRADHEPHLKSERVKKLIRVICRESRQEGREIHQYSRRQIKDTFSFFKVKTKFAISKKIIEWFPKLKNYAIPYRKEWMSEHTNAGIFDALSLAFTHYYLVD